MNCTPIGSLSIGRAGGASETRIFWEIWGEIKK